MGHRRTDHQGTDRRAATAPWRSLLIAVALLGVVVSSGWEPVAAQDTPDAQDSPSTGMTTQDIVPRPNSGRAPTEAGDRGGALQLLILALVVVAVSGAIWHLVRQSQRARSARRAP